jgi:pyruvyltransferase
MIFNFSWNKKKEDSLFLSYDAHRKNLGDILSPIIAEHLGTKKVIRISKRKCQRVEHYFMIGSILQRCTSKSIIWGSGFISEKSICKEIPKNILAVRGPLTRKKLLDQGIECPKVYGDPALLLPEIYPAKKYAAKYKLGIIPHFLDKNDLALKIFSNNSKIKIIDIQNADPLKVVDDILNCEKIVSSSLHGIIISDAYHIPSVWIQFSKPIGEDDFKFQDYFASVERSVDKPFIFNEFKNLNDILKAFEAYEININLENLKNSFPYKK